MANKDLYEGVLLIDKAEGCTSFDVVRQVRKALGVRAVGHTGTLDPFATGLMVVLLGRYTRACPWLTAEEKVYEATIAFGNATDTGDCAGRITETASADHLSQEQVESALLGFLGTQLQIPPIYSAIHVDGERAYDKARRGDDFSLPPREITIHEIGLISWQQGEAKVRVRCSSGTYIRAIARDLGERLGVPAHLSALRRLSVGAFSIEEAIKQSELQAEDRQELAKRLLIGRKALRGLATLSIDSEQVRRLRCGQKIQAVGEFDSACVAFYDDEPIAFLNREADLLVPVRVFPPFLVTNAEAIR